MKKMISGLSLALCLGAILPVQATELEGASPWAVDIVQEAISSNIVPSHLRTGYQDAISRADFCALAVSTYEEATGGEIIGRKTFTDTNDVNVEKMADLGVVSGTSDEEFSPNRPLSREEAAVILTNLSEKLGVPLSEGAISFEDNNEISSWATSAIGKVNQAGIMSGVGNSRFAPKDTYTREQSMITLLNIFQSLGNQEITFLSISPEYVYLSSGDTIQLDAMSNLGVVNDKVTWTTTHPNQFEIEDGFITMGVGGDAAKIIATAENGVSDFCIVLKTEDDVVTTVTDYGNVYGKFPEILAFENVIPEMPVYFQYGSTMDLEIINVYKEYYVYKYQTYYMEEAEELAEKYAYWLRDNGYTLIREEDNPVIGQGVGTNILYELVSPSGDYIVSVESLLRLTDLHISGTITAEIDHTNGTIYDGDFTPGFDPSRIDTVGTPTVTTPVTPTPETTTPSLSSAEITSIKASALKESTSSVRYLTETVSHLGDAGKRSNQGLAIIDVTEALRDLMESSTYAMKTIETIFSLAETDAEYVKMCEYLSAYSLEVEEICENVIALDLPNSYVLLSPLTDGFFTMLTNLILDIDSAADNLKLATAYLEP